MVRNNGLSFLMVLCAPLLFMPIAAVVAEGVAQEQGQHTKNAKKLQLFGSREIRNRSVKSFAKWSQMWRRHNLPKSADVQLGQKASPRPRRCHNKSSEDCSQEAWDKFVEEQKGLPLGELLTAVNQYMNRSNYIVDPVNWGVPDYWETPAEFFLRDGDCEDYAISKYVTLKRLGVDINHMRLVILQDENLRAAHAILAVKHDGKYMILDNQVNAVLPDTQILHYRPVYSINEGGWWLHHRRSFSSK